MSRAWPPRVPEGVRDPSERSLVDGLRHGDETAFDAAYARYRSPLYGFLLRLSRRRDVADDLFQDTWVKLARHAHRLDPETDLRAWLFRVARNAWVSHARWSMFDVSRLAALEYAAPSPAPWTDAEGRTDAARKLHRLEQALASLQTAHREVLLLVAVEGFEQEQAAAILGISHVALRQRLSRARAQLASKLGTGEKDREAAR